MKVSEQWLRTWCNPNWTTHELSEALSLAGLEVDDVAPVAPDFSGVVVAEVVSVDAHPDAEKLRVAQVNVGDDALVQIVCGAPNVRPGIKVPCAKVGAILPDSFKIKKAKLRGVESFGMLCSATELGLEQDYDGLWELAADLTVGEDIRSALALDDQLIEVDLTPNRADCLSVEGLARELAVVSHAPFKTPFELSPLTLNGSCPQAVVIEEQQACLTYLGCVVTDYNTQAATPDWMAQRLIRSGLRPISLLVDITNYVMLELGQPMHAFDADKLQGPVRVRYAQAGEQLVTLDEKTLQLSANTLVIADDQGPLALAGIMGGLASSVTEQTQRLFFECAHFTPDAIVGKARQYGLHTDSSHRFERGVDPALPAKALTRALNLLQAIAGGWVSEWVVAGQSIQAGQATKTPIMLRRSRVTQLLGTAIEDSFITQLLARLGCQVVANDQAWSVTPPTYRFDLTIEVDLIEEIARVYGYNNLAVNQAAMPLNLKPLPESEQELHTLRMALVGRGYHEVISYSFVEESAVQQLSPEIPYVQIKNPISEDMSTMRTSLFPGLLGVLSYNQKRQQARVRIFETGLIFSLEDGQMQQVPVLGGLIYGQVAPVSWQSNNRKVDFYDLKGDVEALLAMSHLHDQVSFVPAQSPEFHPGQCAHIHYAGQTIGLIGQLHPQWLKPFGVQGPVFMFQIFQDSLLTKQVPQVTGISKFPEVQRDLAFVVEKTCPVANILASIKSLDNSLIKQIQVFDVYEGTGLAESQKSVAISLKIQHNDRTLTDDEVDQLIQQVIDRAHQRVGASLR
ncbi:phenylalanyl-tRNA synthetase subunit beta [Thiomicrospira aerophila AL3]|uniref:Phenylalanine--tRNA ligase beta subunit n=1 Tax=Thiomicrospira aerophila AL3 TaxID=717772 RepID=W0DYG0_9GAMM|nr:phenylalanine--tRNA ligase subunit beta [Thiomicrospira aerophila]AHF01891.1 phenylalanyl-tRNA synthetase subunit beta [Thiomicrospira aerophila AL3]